jgi:sec-independent protein translocase protein TatA
MSFLSSLPLAFIQNLGTTEVILILLVILLLFGAKRLPELARGVGKSFKEFKRGLRDAEEDIRNAIDDEDKPSGDQQKLSNKETSDDEKKPN